MMNIRNAICVLACFVLIGACESKNVQLKEEVIAIHDEVMPHMGKLKSLQKELIQQAEQLKLEDSISHSQHIATLRETAAELDAAYEGMFVWMRHFEPDQGALTDEAYEEYLKEQKELVEKVKNDINASLTKAESLQ